MNGHSIFCLGGSFGNVAVARWTNDQSRTDWSSAMINQLLAAKFKRMTQPSCHLSGGIGEMAVHL